MNTSQHNRSTSLPLSSKLNMAGLLGFGAMIVVQIAGGVDSYPVVPPGLVGTLVVVAVVVFAARWRWSSIVGALWPLALTVGAFLASGSMEALGGDEGLFVQVTSIVQRLFLLVALVSGLVALVGRYWSDTD